MFPLSLSMNRSSTGTTCSRRLWRIRTNYRECAVFSGEDSSEETLTTHTVFGSRKPQRGSAHWSASTGTVIRYPYSTNRFVAELLNLNKVFSELTASFDSAGLDLTVRGVEKVRTGHFPGDGKANGKYPIDCVVTFDVSKKVPKSDR